MSNFILSKIFQNKVFWFALLAASVFAFGYAAHVKSVSSAIEAAMNSRDIADAKELERIAGEAKIKTDRHVADLVAIEQKSFEQGKRNEKIISDLRSDVNNGTRKLRQYATACNNNLANISGAVGAGDAAGGAIESRIAKDSERTIRAVEIGLTALQYWDEAQAIIRADRTTINTK
jgi:hypothetical protein